MKPETMGAKNSFNRHKIPKVGRAQPFDCWGHWCEQIVAAVVGEEAQEHDEQGESGGACGGFLAFVGEFDCVWGLMCVVRTAVLVVGRHFLWWFEGGFAGVECNCCL